MICNYTADFFPWILFFIAVSIITFLFIIALKQKNEWKTPVSITLITGLVFSFFLSQYQDKQREINANTLVKALSKYEIDQGEFPLFEKKLIPKYLSKIPNNSRGFKNIDFNYIVSQDKSSFSIDYTTREGYKCYYTSSIEEWQFGD